MYIIIILISIILLSLIASQTYYKNKETYKSPTTLPPNYTKYNTELTEISMDPTGEPLAFDADKNNFNYTQLYYAFLVQLFKTLSSRKKDFDKKLVKYYAKNTVDYHNMDSLKLMLSPFINKLQQMANDRTDFHIVGYESWKIFQVKNSPLKINEIDLFLYDRVNWTQVRLLVQIVELPKKDAIGRYECRKVNEPQLKTVAAMTTPEFPTYPIGIPSNDQLIPLPTEVIISGKNVENQKGVNYPEPCSFEKLWVNWVEIVNSSLVLNAFENYPDVQLQGINRIPFDYTKYTPPGPNGKQNPFQLTAEALNQWPTLDDQPRDIKNWPATPEPFGWFSDGTVPKVNPTRKSPGIRHDLTQTPLTASFFNSYFNQPRGQTSYTWMFANSAIIPSQMYHSV